MCESDLVDATRDGTIGRVPRPDRRLLIAEAVLELSAAGGTHAVTHQSIDRHLDLPKGSTSYYFRTRSALMDAAVDRLIAKSRDQFEDLLTQRSVPADLIATYAANLVSARRTDVLARQALLLDAEISPQQRDALVGCFFSQPAAVALMKSIGDPSPEQAAAQLITILEGVAFTRTATPIRGGVRARRREVRELVVACVPRLASGAGE